MSFIADQIAELSKPDVRKDLIRFRESINSLLISRCLPGSVEGFCDLIKKEFPSLSKLLDSTLKLALVGKPLSLPRLVDWIFKIIRQVPLEGFGIYDPPKLAKTKWEASLIVGGYIPGSLDMEILVGLCEKTFPNILQVKGPIQPYIGVCASNKRIDLIRHELFLPRGEGEEKSEDEPYFEKIEWTKRRKFNESEVDLHEFEEGEVPIIEVWEENLIH